MLQKGKEAVESKPVKASSPEGTSRREYVPSSTRSNKETQLIFSPDPANLERTIRKEARSLSTDNNTFVSLDSAQPPSTQTPVPSTDSCSPLSTDNTNLPSTDILHPTSIDIPSRTSIDTEPRDMVAPLILVRDNNGDLHDQEGQLRNAAVTSIDTQPQQRCRKRASTDTAYYKSVDSDFNRVRDGDYSIGSWADEHHHESFAIQEEAAWERTRFSQSINSRHQQSIDTLPQQSIDTNNTTSINNRPIPKTTISEQDKLDNQYLTPDKFGIFRDPDSYAKAIDSHTLHVSREDIADILQTANGADNLFMHQRSNPGQKTTKKFYDTAGGIENSFKQRSRHTTHPSIDVDVATSVNRQPEFGRRAVDFNGTRRFYWEEKDQYGVYKDDQGYTRDLYGSTISVHINDIKRLLERASKDEPAYICLPEHVSSFTQTKLVLEIYTKDEINEMFYGVEPSQELFTFVDCSQKNSGGIVRDLEVQIGNALVPVDFHVLDIKLNWNSSLLLGRAFLSTVGAVCNLQTNQLCLTLIDPNAHYDPIPVKPPQTIPRRINDPGIIAACHCGAEYKSDYSESIDTHPVTLIDTQPQQRCRKRASTDTAYYKSVDTDFNRVRDGDYSIGSRADEHHHESFAVETATYTPGADKLQDSFTDEELLNMQKRDDTD
ncbi:hypothetical protein F2Q69_00052694 [Brassica cretica]|uniref:Uncharacterized protein n=1 Tax=Brassica cretica TaxID=69181 RepID=A0A8S9MSW7_BRACR|nr:hypothetical protein F2Q69_00052694 [Brassica cretica]